MPNIFVSLVPSTADRRLSFAFLRTLRHHGYQVDATAETAQFLTGSVAVEACVELCDARLSAYGTLCLGLSPLSSLKNAPKLVKSEWFALVDEASTHHQVVLCDERDYAAYMLWEKIGRPMPERISGLFRGIARLICATYQFRMARSDASTLNLGPHQFGPMKVIAAELGMYRGALDTLLAEEP
jgi:hypothetical protein